MKRRQKPGKISLAKRPNDQKLIETFLLLNQAKTENKHNKVNKIDKKDKTEESVNKVDNEQNKISNNIQDIKNKSENDLDIDEGNKNVEEQSKKDLEKAEIDFIQRQNELRLINRGMFFEQDNKKLIEEIKITNPELYKKISVEEEMIFPIMIDTNLGIYKELISSKIEEIFKKILKNEENWLEVIPIIDVNIVNLKIKDPDDDNNFIVIGYITKAISYQIYLLSLNNLISTKIYAHKNGRRLAIFIGLNYYKYSIKVDYVDEKEHLYKLHFKSDLVLGDDIYKILKELKKKYTPLEIYKQEFLTLLNNIKDENKVDDKKNENENNDESTMDEENNEKKRNLADYLVNNVEKILSMTISYDNLFTENDKKYYNIFLELNQQEKTTLLKFLRRKNRWQNIKKLFNNENNDSNKEIIENIDIIIASLLEKKLISNFTEIVGDFRNLDNNKLFEYLYYLSMDELKKIKSELNKICKNLSGKQTKQLLSLSPFIKENFINNPFYNLNIFISTDKNNDSFFKDIIIKTSEKITKFNFSQENISKTKLRKEVGFNPILMNTKVNKNAIYNNQYINTFLNYSNFKSIHLSNNLLIGNKINFINDIISQINTYLKEKRSAFLESFVVQTNNNNINNNFANSKQKTIEKIFEKYNEFLFCINENLARVMDITSRLFFFYTDCKDLNDIGREFYEIERYELYNYSCDENNKIFREKNVFNLYDTIYQIKNSYLIFSMFNSNEMKYPLFFYEILQTLSPFLLEVSNKKVYDTFLSKESGINLDYLKDDIIEKINEKLTKNLLLSFNPKDVFFNIENNNLNEINNNINYNNISFIDKYKPEYIAAQMLYYYVLNLERNKKFKLANLFYLFLLNCFDNSFILRQRGLIYYRIILNYSFHLKSNKNAIEIINICIKYDIKHYKIIKNGDLFKIKTYYDKFNKLKNNTKNKGNNKILNLLIPYNFKEINNDDFDIKKIIKEIEADSLYSANSGRRRYNLTEGKFAETANVEDFALNYYLKEENLKGIHGENMVIPALYTLLLWEEIFDDKTPLVFQSKFQAFPLDFYEKDFFINRKEIISAKLDKIQNYNKEQLIKHLQLTYDIKNGIKNPCVEWNSRIYDKDILIKIGIAFGPKKLTEVFKVILNQGLKNVKSGMPDLFLWSEKGQNKFKEKIFYAEIGSIKLVEVKSVNDKLSDNQKFWLKTFYDRNINVEVLHIK